MDWGIIKHFKKKEFGEGVENLDSNLIWLLDEFRKAVGYPIKIHCAWATNGHSPNSYHYKGQAIDCHIEELSLQDQFMYALRFGAWKGIGIYPLWNNPGLHLDIRKAPLTVMWWQDVTGSYKSITTLLLSKLI